MCGITGWINFHRDVSQELPVVEAMTGRLVCRGPDADGVWCCSHAALGHCRLVVVDPVGGTQPMTRQRGDCTYTLVYNGELYNTDELRQELLGRGHSFHSHSDTEVLLASYLEWGSRCVERINGIFAFAVWEEKHQRLYLARDRLGVKPLFYTVRGDSFLFGSELKSLLAHPQVEAVIDREGLAEIFALGPARTPGHGVFRDISELRPGHFLEVTPDGIHKQPYWSLESRPHTDDWETTVSTVRSLVLDAIERQLVADVPVATLLSGGLDSSAITAVAAEVFRRQGSGPLHTYSIDYVGNDRHFQASAFQPNADAPWVKRMSDYCGTIHHTIQFDTPELIDALKRAVIARDLPGMTDIDASLYLFCREIKRETTVVLSGECADEIFGGYPWFHREETLQANTFPWALMTRERASWLSPELREWVGPEEYVARRYQETLAEVPPLPDESPLEARRREMSYLNLTWFMSVLLDRKDRMSMAASLEARVPFCDHRIVEYVWNVPWEMKSRGEREKGLLRHALQGILPEEVLFRKKSPYPKTHNPAYAEATRSWLLDVLNDPTSPLLPLIDVRTIRELTASDAAASGTPWFGQLMSKPQLFAYLASIDYWMREYGVSIR
ncbi:asparagine synthase (glutamine-hydrolyzing) [Brevibacillus humidisoli]|uniref:asparagine synthase (glutamine-hydrolyzing) n=1 Tax=Brevibacillus humidisoli TaxID=2895522 RepID=UPI001E294245|nr:asparagine synthase (glutamine-hydrolyzing) [Brevibacillus humidisoli]UFJ43045.1 asparagine synthase (glutamine-hydrolyzing) [Brevibacillus humidisoli]